MGEFMLYANGKPQASHTTHESWRFVEVRDASVNMLVV
jgi:hypothetical protein